MSWVNAMPCRTGVGRSGSIPHCPASPVADRAGELIARIILASIWPCSAGIRNRPWVVPSSSSRMVNVVRCSARASSASSCLPSNFSASSGAITSNRCRPKTRNAFASWCAASPTRCASAAARCSAVTANSPLFGNRPSAATITRACAVFTRLVPIAVDRQSWCSSFSASFRSDRASRRTCRLSTASQSAAVAAPEATVASEHSACASSRSFNAASCASSWEIRTSTARVCSGVMDSSGTAATEPRSQPTRSTTPTTG